MKYKYIFLNPRLFIICLSPLLLMCSEIAAQQLKVDVEKAIVNKRWKLIALNGKQIQGTSYAHYLILHSKGAIAESKMGCNQLRNPYSLNNKGNLHFGNGTSTMMACPNQEIEEAYCQALLHTKRFILRKQQLFLIGVDKKILASFQLVPKEDGRTFVGKTFVQEATQSFDPILGGAPFLRFESRDKASLKLGDIVERMEVQYEDNLITMRSEFHSQLMLFKIVNNEVLIDDNGITWILKN